MDDSPGPFLGFLRELKRRNVYRVAVTYAVVAFVVWQAASLLFPALRFPAWTTDFVIVLTLLGFPIALVLAWAFEMTAEGVRRTPEAEPVEEEGAPEATRSPSRVALKALVGLGLVAAVVAGGWYLTGGGGDTEPRAGERSIAVLPFEALGQAEPDAFTEGMHDDLLGRLSNVSGLKVIARTSVQQYRDTEKTAAEIARELGVRWVLEGGVQEMGDQIQVNAQLIDPRTDTHAWAESYRRDLTTEDLFDIQSEITRRIARSLETELTAGEEERIERRPTESLEAYRLYVRGRSRLNARSAEGVRRAIDYFRRALDRDSSYALAWAGLADARGLYSTYASGSLGDSIVTSEEAARRALEFDPDLAEAHASLGFIHFQRQHGPVALRRLERAVELKPSYAQAHHWLGFVLLTLGRLEEARDHVSLAVELDPRHPAARATLVGLLLSEGREEEALEEAHRISRSHPGLAWRRQPEAWVLQHMGRWEEAVRLAHQELPSGDRPEFWFRQAAVAEAGSGDTAAARERLRRMEGDGTDYFGAGLVHALLGEEEAAFSAFRKEKGWDQVPVVIVRYGYPAFLDPLRDDPRYRELLRRINRQWGLNPDGSLPDSVDVSFGEQPDD